MRALSLPAIRKSFQTTSLIFISRADCFHKLAVIADKRGERDKAIAMAKSALELDADHTGARTLIALLSNPR